MNSRCFLKTMHLVEHAMVGGADIVVIYKSFVSNMSNHERRLSIQVWSDL